ncbi:MAG: hypothetical protein COU33_01710 [Candidatus Magasanikbacteria bacterium CG10_big_fil_rev_8_21_14_0_10_43_6]|uniref:Amidohydrolase-related domain-containing protein n=1 Tax=Candidatus Magasanikbacteria bacterium CG10_big_fil_rev_8_21_14_0_10_43_6 TaxID=1974650 RepID=A0A2M6W1U7_9BACT|nr:MAG: hypothetical protein COU33_01710 [Candidatus Magasanikbacteria bacterium CG10_big_fil_rev_8_21_14_0_10_43_6]
MHPWNLKEKMLEHIREKGGFVNCHAHFDKAFYITKDGLDQSMLDMETKWNMSDELKRNSTEEDIATRLRHGLDSMVAQGCTLTATFIDAYHVVGHRAIDAALKVREAYKDRIDVRLMGQPLGGLTDISSIQLFESVTEKCDIVGGLPSKDRPHDDRHFDILFHIAKNQDKPLHIHIDQENSPNERDTEKLIHYTKKYGYEGRVVAVHAISVSAQPKEYRTRIYQELADAGIAVVVSPSAALGMRQLDQFNGPIHNSIANVPEMIEAGVVVGLGVDNIYDFYQPFVDGDMWTELRMLQEACRYYNFDELVHIATTNGRKILNIT